MSDYRAKDEVEFCLRIVGNDETFTLGDLGFTDDELQRMSNNEVTHAINEVYDNWVNDTVTDSWCWRTGPGVGS